LTLLVIAAQRLKHSKPDDSWLTNCVVKLRNFTRRLEKKLSQTHKVVIIPRKQSIYCRLIELPIRFANSICQFSFANSICQFSFANSVLHDANGGIDTMSLFRNTAVVALLTAVFANFSGLSNANAQPNPEVATGQQWQAAIESHHRTVRSWEKSALADATYAALKVIKNDIVGRLKKAGYPEDARIINEGFNQIPSNLFHLAAAGILDVGDYTPLNFWFADTYKRLKARFGNVVDMVALLGDLNTLNYSIPVVFRPRGNQMTGEDWDINEYRTHFVPFSRVVTYWVTWMACVAIRRDNPMQAMKTCKKPAEWLSLGFSLFVAPPLSNWIYTRARQQSDLKGPHFNLTRVLDLYKADPRVQAVLH
jgi:hypothetical protein